MNRRFLFVMCAGALMAGCGGEGSQTKTGDEANILAHVLANSAEVFPDRLEFPRASVSADLRGRIDAYERAMRDGKSQEDVENVILVADRADNAVESEGR